MPCNALRPRCSQNNKPPTGLRGGWGIILGTPRPWALPYTKGTDNKWVHQDQSWAFYSSLESLHSQMQCRFRAPLCNNGSLMYVGIHSALLQEGVGFYVRTECTWTCRSINHRIDNFVGKSPCSAGMNIIPKSVHNWLLLFPPIAGSLEA